MFHIGLKWTRQDNFIESNHGDQIMSMSNKYNHNKEKIKKHKYNCTMIVWLGNIKYLEKKKKNKVLVTSRMCLQSKRDNSKLL